MRQPVFLSTVAKELMMALGENVDHLPVAPNSPPPKPVPTVSVLKAKCIFGHKALKPSVTLT